MRYSFTGDTLTDAADKIQRRPEIWEPCISLAVTAKKQGDEEKVFSGLHRLEEKGGSTITVTKNSETGDMLINGMGEMHIEVTCQKLKNKFGVEAALREPKVAYRETIKKTAEAEGRHKKQSGGAGQYGVIQIRFRPHQDGSADFRVVNAIVGGVVPKEFIPAVEKRASRKHCARVLAGYPMVICVLHYLMENIIYWTLRKWHSNLLPVLPIKRLVSRQSLFCWSPSVKFRYLFRMNIWETLSEI